MHDEARQFVAAHAPAGRVSVCEIGSRFINGGLRDLFDSTKHVGVDIVGGLGVNIVADAATWEPPELFDVVVCCEVFEHTEVWPQIVATCGKALRPGGTFITTCAGPGREPHGAVGGDVGDEWYGNVSTVDLNEHVALWGNVVVLEQVGGDTRCVATKRGDQ
jgi:SAM-dependent methyltransferase